MDPLANEADNFIEGMHVEGSAEDEIHCSEKEDGRIENCFPRG